MLESAMQLAEELPQKVLVTARRHGLESYILSEPLVIGVSGGPDSLALLHILLTLRSPAAHRTLHVAHLDHSLRGTASEEDALFVAELAETWGLSCTVRHFDVEQYARNGRLSIEEAARNVRYAFFAALAHQQGASVAVAHNADDQVETVLMHILRGSGISGLKGMRMLAPLPAFSSDNPFTEASDRVSLRPVALFRPLLAVWRHEIEAYCTEAGLQPRLDQTNTDPQYRRNRVRHELIPLLERDYNPAVKGHIYDLAELAAGEDELVENIVESEARSLADITDEGAVRFDPTAIAALPKAIRLRLARWALKRVAGTLEGFTHRHIEESASIFSAEVDSARAADLPHELTVEQGKGWSVVRHRSYMQAPQAEDAQSWPLMRVDVEHELIPGRTLYLEAGWQLEIAIVTAESEKRIPSDLFMLFDADELEKMGPLTLRTRRPSDFIKPLGMKGRKTLQDIFIDAKIPRRARNYIPLLSCSTETSEVLWLPGKGGRRSAHAPIGPQTRQVLRLEFVNK